MLTLKYERKDFFNNTVYTEDTKQNYDKQDLKKAFSYLSKTHDASIQMEDTVIFWSSTTEFENRIATIRDFDGWNYTETKKSFDKAKKECYALVS